MDIQAESSPKNVRSKVRRALGQMDRMRDKVLGEMSERFPADMEQLRSGVDNLLRLVGEGSKSLASQNDIPLPTVVKRTLGRVNGLIDRFVENPVQQENSSVQDDVRAQAQGEGEQNARPKPQNKRRRRRPAHPGAGRRGKNTEAGNKPPAP